MTATFAPSVDEAPETESVEPANPARRRRWLPWAVAGVGLILFIVGEQTIPAAGASQWGLLVTVSPAYGLSLLAATVAFVIAVRH